MSKASRASLWLPPISLVVIALIMGLISFSSKRFSPVAVTGQALLLVIALRTFCYWPPMIRFVAGMPGAHRIIFGFLVGSMVIGHYTLNARTYFPYVAWEIFPFVNERDPVTCREFIATTASGGKVRLLVEQLFPSIVQIYPLDSYTPEQTDHLARAMAKVYNEHHASDPVQEIDLVVLAVQLHPPANESRTQPSCELLKHYDISSDRWN